MELKYKAAIASVSILAAFAAGRYTLPAKVVTVTKTVEVEKKTTETDTEREKHKKTTVVEEEKPDGTKKKTTTTTEDSDTKKKTDTKDETRKDETETKTVTGSESKVTISALGGLHINGLSSKVVYGASVTKPILGPLTVGAFVLSDPSTGVSIGLTF